MIVYGGQEEVVDSSGRFSALRALLRSLEKESDHDAVVALLIAWGVFESAAADALSPEVDSDHPLLRPLRQASLLIGRLFDLSVQQKSTEMRSWLNRLGRLLENPCFSKLPRRITPRVPEGYAYYGLYPETYLESALRFFREVGPQPAVVIGIRSIGASLSAVVAAALEARGGPICSYTVRPRGHPFDRSLLLSASFEADLARKKESYFLIVDEGPGLSGSSMTCVAGKLCALGVAENRILFFPSWVPDGRCFRAEAARSRWRRHRKITTSFEELFLDRGGPFSPLPTGSLLDLSAGRWRSHFYQTDAAYPAVQPQHERRKYLAPESAARRPQTPRRGPAASGEGSARLFKFAGLGEYGRSKRARAERLADAGWGPPVLGLTHGFLITAFVAGMPLSEAKVDSTLIEAMARYLAALRQFFPSARGRSFDEMIEMIRVNVTEGVGAEWGDRVGRLERFRSRVEAGVPTAIDGRMFPHEWLQTPRGYLKTDGVDHHDDHFFPGCQDIAWDLAGASIEFALEPAARAELIRRYQSLAKDHAVADRLPFFRVAYLAYRLGYASLAAEALDPSSDAARFRSLTHRYRSFLLNELNRLSASSF